MRLNYHQKKHCEELAKLKEDLYASLENFNQKFSTVEQSTNFAETQSLLDDLAKEHNELKEALVRIDGELLLNKIPSYKHRNAYFEAIPENEMLYIGPEQLQEIFQTYGMSIPDHEMERMRSLIGKIYTPVVDLKRELFVKETEGHIAPIMMILPQVIVLNGKEVPFNIRTLVSSEFHETIWKYWEESAKKSNLENTAVPIFFARDQNRSISDTNLDKDSSFPKELFDKVWGESPKMYTTEELHESDFDTNEDALTYIENLFSSGYELPKECWGMHGPSPEYAMLEGDFFLVQALRMLGMKGKLANSMTIAHTNTTPSSRVESYMKVASLSGNTLEICTTNDNSKFDSPSFEFGASNSLLYPNQLD